MDYYWIWYIFNTIISTFLSFVTFYVVVYKSPREMKVYRWILLNIQISAYVETVYWCIFFGPKFELYPMILFTPIGIAISWMSISGPIITAIAIFLHGIIDGGLAIGLFYRYYLLRPIMNIHPPKIFFILPPVAQYVIGGGGCGLCCLFSFLDPDTTKKLYQETNPNGTFPEGYAIAFGGPGLIYWASLLAFAIVCVCITVSLVLGHSVWLIQQSAFSMQNKNIHKSAIQSLLLQMATTFSCSLLPMVVFTYVLIQDKTNREEFTYLNLFAPVCLAFFSMKAIVSSLTCILATQPYRKFVFFKLGMLKQETSVFIVQPSVSLNH